MSLEKRVNAAIDAVKNMPSSEYRKLCKEAGFEIESQSTAEHPYYLRQSLSPQECLFSKLSNKGWHNVLKEFNSNTRDWYSSDAEYCIWDNPCFGVENTHSEEVKILTKIEVDEQYSHGNKSMTLEMSSSGMSEVHCGSY